MDIKTREINLGSLKIGGASPISVQTMTNADSTNYIALKAQVNSIEKIGAEIIRISAPTESAVNNIAKLQKETNVPLIADIHFNPDMAIKSIESNIPGIRINPGNIGNKEKVSKIIELAKKHNTAIRIGVNAGSLEKELLLKYGHPNPQALVESTMNWINFVEKHKFVNFKVSIKSSDIKTTIDANSLFTENSNIPLHIGLTEAGPIISGLIKSTITMEKLLSKNIGNTIRISLSSSPEDEVIAGFKILKALGFRKGVNIVSCPTCSRTMINVIEFSQKIERLLNPIRKNITVAVMGCVVNGPGEAGEADIAILGTKEKNILAIFFKGKHIKNVQIEDLYKEISNIIAKH